MANLSFSAACKARRFYWANSARLKSCPVTKRLQRSLSAVRTGHTLIGGAFFRELLLRRDALAASYFFCMRQFREFRIGIRPRFQESLECFARAGGIALQLLDPRQPIQREA